MSSSRTDAETAAISSVLDASALLAVVLEEPGRQRVIEAMRRGAAISAVNLAEVGTRLLDLGLPLELLQSTLTTFSVSVHEFDESASLRCAELRPATRHIGLALGDRACLALAQEMALPVMTADRIWAGLSIGIEVDVIR